MWKEKTTYSIYGESKAEHPFGSVKLDWDELTPDADGLCTITLPRLAVTRGRVTLPDGTPVPGVLISRSNHKACGHGLVATDMNGEYTLEENVGQFLDVAPESMLGAAPGVFAWDCGDGSQVKRLDFVLEKGIRIHGRVTRPDGSVPAIYEVSLYEKDPNPESDADKVYCDREGCAQDEAICIRQTGRGIKTFAEEPVNGVEISEEYEYILPAAART